MSKSTNDLIWAEEVMEVYTSLGSLAGSRDLSSPSANHLLMWAQQEENATKFLADLVPKATAVLAKHRPIDVDDAVVEKDKKTITELKLLLRDAVDESNEVGTTNDARSHADEGQALQELLGD